MCNLWGQILGMSIFQNLMNGISWWLIGTVSISPVSHHEFLFCFLSWLRHEDFRLRNHYEVERNRFNKFLPSAPKVSRNIGEHELISILCKFHYHNMEERIILYRRKLNNISGKVNKKIGSDF